MVLSYEQRVELLAKARLVKQAKKAEKDKEKPTPVKGRPKKAKAESKILDLGDVADETNVEELAEDIKKIEINKVEEPTNTETELPQQEEEEVEIVEEIIQKKKKPKKKIIRRYIEPSSSSEDEQEIIEEFIKKKPSKKKTASQRYNPYPPNESTIEPTPIDLGPPTLNIFSY